ncbi:MAG: magnesium and cobalt exporter, family [Tenuifilum sp.]|uniref:gliding motility-associated protein GldE n=1 Tax=Tenuifilum sp. TaxID=2760880 RepID=UPI0024ABAB35|nr:gliding motility-associated protein GldE [Tenuifilum sp.]MDI3528059.1 magnesium and cobalt exporter, family [Tenuifilum sp.]
MSLESFSNLFHEITNGVLFTPPTFGFYLGLIVLCGLLILSALFSGSEVAYFSLTPAEIKELEDKSKKSKVLTNLSNPEQFLATLLVANNLINVGVVILSTFLTLSVFDFSQAPVFGFVFQTVIITFILLLFGEILPKLLASNRALRFAEVVAPLISAMIILLKPLSKLLIHSSTIINKRVATPQKISMDELGDAIELTAEELAEERQILEGIVSFTSTIVSEIMKPRIDVVALDLNTSYEKLREVVIESGYSRIPIYNESFDDIKGILYVKDLIPHIQKDNTFRWQNLIRPPYFVPESKKINDLLTEFQLKHIHMAIVVDEYGGTSGIVTLEDILEEIVGEISDESDDDERLYTKIDDKNYIFEAKVMLNDFCKIVGCDDDIFDDVRGDAETIAGLILEKTGQIPKQNEKVDCKQFTFTIDAVDNRRIKRVRVKINEDAES